jgi:hypothetical protein
MATIKYFLATVIFYIYSAALVLAQNEQKDVNVDINVKSGGWYTNWWVWGIVAMLFIITIIAIASRGRRD